LVLLLQGQVGIKAGGSNNYKYTALGPLAAAPAQVQAAAASPQAQAAAQAEDPSPTSVAADLGEEGEMGIITATLGDLSLLEAAAEMDVDREDITAELEWGDDAGHTADDDSVNAAEGEAMVED
jgi:hypothetical protein